MYSREGLFIKKNTGGSKNNCLQKKKLCKGEFSVKSWVWDEKMIYSESTCPKLFRDVFRFFASAGIKEKCKNRTFSLHIRYVVCVGRIMKLFSDISRWNSEDNFTTFNFQKRDIFRQDMRVSTFSTLDSRFRQNPTQFQWNRVVSKGTDCSDSHILTRNVPFLKFESSKIIFREN
jgi:hypothetical protein